ncbi:hypothetical protein HK102_004468 [Quaeritorhiza haematococci]|nr:hypothetical protein HK102_004468 [Quaeritorhiza haematococci]
MKPQSTKKSWKANQIEAAVMMQEFQDFGNSNGDPPHPHDSGFPHRHSTCTSSNDVGKGRHQPYPDNKRALMSPNSKRRKTDGGAIRSPLKDVNIPKQGPTASSPLSQPQQQPPPPPQPLTTLNPLRTPPSAFAGIGTPPLFDSNQFLNDLVFTAPLVNSNLITTPLVTPVDSNLKTNDTTPLVTPVDSAISDCDFEAISLALAPAFPDVTTMAGTTQGAHFTNVNTLTHSLDDSVIPTKCSIATMSEKTGKTEKNEKTEGNKKIEQNEDVRYIFDSSNPRFQKKTAFLGRSYSKQGNQFVETPEYILKYLIGKFGPLRDPCPMNPCYDGLTVPWSEKETNFVNPPYKYLAPWLNKAIQERKPAVFLIPFRPHTRYFRDLIYKQATVYILPDLIKFKGYSHRLPIAMCLAVFFSDVSLALPLHLPFYFSDALWPMTTVGLRQGIQHLNDVFGYEFPQAYDQAHVDPKSRTRYTCALISKLSDETVLKTVMSQGLLCPGIKRAKLLLVLPAYFENRVLQGLLSDVELICPFGPNRDLSLGGSKTLSIFPRVILVLSNHKTRHSQKRLPVSNIMWMPNSIGVGIYFATRTDPETTLATTLATTTSATTTTRATTTTPATTTTATTTTPITTTPATTTTTPATTTTATTTTPATTTPAPVPKWGEWRCIRNSDNGFVDTINVDTSRFDVNNVTSYCNAWRSACDLNTAETMDTAQTMDTAETMDTASTETKTCIRCQKALSLDSFSKDGRNTCKPCKRCQQKEKHEADAAAGEQKTCSVCKETKPRNKFHGSKCNTCHHRAKTAKKVQAVKTLEAQTEGNVDVRDLVHQPEKCCQCGNPFHKDRFTFAEGRFKSMCKACFNGKAYYKAYRERQRNKNLAAFLARNAKVAREYRAKRPEVMEAYNAQRRNTLEGRLLSIENYARRRGIFFDPSKKPEFLVNMERPCEVCGHDPILYQDVTDPEAVNETAKNLIELQVTNGLMRIDHKLGFTVDNTLTACKRCNIYRRTVDIPTFLSKANDIAIQHAETEIPSNTPLCTDDGWGAGKTRSGFKHIGKCPKDLDTSLPENCHYCGNEGHGVDRLDSNKPYTPDNAVRACWDCNLIKGDSDYFAFLKHMSAIAGFQADHPIVTESAVAESAIAESTVAESNVAAQTKDALQHGVHPRWKFIAVFDSLNADTLVAVYKSIVDLERVLGVRYLTTQIYRSENGLLLDRWQIEHVTNSEKKELLLAQVSDLRQSDFEILARCSMTGGKASTTAPASTATTTKRPLEAVDQPAKKYNKSSRVFVFDEHQDLKLVAVYRTWAEIEERVGLRNFRATVRTANDGLVYGRYKVDADLVLDSEPDPNDKETFETWIREHKRTRKSVPLSKRKGVNLTPIEGGQIRFFATLSDAAREIGTSTDTRVHVMDFTSAIKSGKPLKGFLVNEVM